jgi:hypothetical protein
MADHAAKNTFEPRSSFVGASVFIAVSFCAAVVALTKVRRTSGLAALGYLSGALVGWIVIALVTSVFISSIGPVSASG